MDHTLDPIFASALRRELTALPTARTRPARRKRTATAAIAASALGAVVFGGVTAIASGPPPGEVADAPLAPPIIVSGVGPVTLPLPPAPAGAVYLKLEMTCFDGTRCWTFGGGVEGPFPADFNMVQRDALPVTDAVDPTNPQRLPRLDPAVGLPIDVDQGTHWRLYAVYTDDRDPETAPMEDGRTLGIPGLSPTDLIPAVGTDGTAGWIEYMPFTHDARPELTPTGVRQAPVPLYGDDGVTVIGEADVSRSHE